MSTSFALSAVAATRNRAAKGLSDAIIRRGLHGNHGAAAFHRHFGASGAPLRGSVTIVFLAAGGAVAAIATSNEHGPVALDDGKGTPKRGWFWGWFGGGGGSSDGAGESKASAATSGAIVDQLKKLPRKTIGHHEVSVWAKDGRYVVMLGAINHSPRYADLAGSLVRDVKPAAVFLDINQKSFMDMYIATRVEASVSGGTGDGDEDKKDDLWKKLVILGDVDYDLPPVPSGGGDHSTSAFSKWKDPTKKSLASFFAKVRYAGLNSVEMDNKVESWTHFVRALEEAQAQQMPMLLGGRDFDSTQERGAEAMENTDAGAAKQLAESVGITWDEFSTPRENFAKLRNLMQEKTPAFYQVYFEELEDHLARKLTTAKDFNLIVAIVMMIHADGVEKQLQKNGWQRVSV